MSEEDAKFLSKMETSKAEDQHEQLESDNLDNTVVAKKEEEGGVKIVKCETLVKQELDETKTDSGGIRINEKLLTNGRGSTVEQQDTKADSRVGKLKVRSFALLAEPIHLTPSSPQANLHTNSIQDEPEAPFNLTFPKSCQIRSPTETHESKENITNSSLTETQVYLRNQSVQLVSDNYRCPDGDSFPNMPAVSDRPLLMQFPARSVQCPRDIPTTSISILNSYVPLNIPSVQPRPFVQSPISVPSVSSFRNTNVSLVSDQKNVSSGHTASPLSLENATMSSETNCQAKEEITIEKETESPETPATEVPITHSTPTNMNMIVKAELDLGVPGDDPEPSSLNNLNDVRNHFLTSDSICPSEQLVVNPVLNVDPVLDVDPRDLKPRSKPKGKLLCKVCDFRHDCMYTMENHVEKLHSAKYNYRCFICTTAAYKKVYKFPSFRVLEHHVATVHRGEKRFQCSKCDRNFKTKPAAVNHMAKIHKYEPIKPFACHLCSFTCKALAVLEKHCSTHNETTEECPVCLKMIRQSRMQEHMCLHNRMKKPPKKRTCGTCDYATPSIALLRKHFKNTKHNKEFRCQLCKYATNFEKDFKKHTISCNINNPYVCTFPGCDKIFYVKKQYVTHSRIHLFSKKMKLHKCVDKDCDFQTLAKCHLVTHLKMTKHHLRFKCPDCTVRYRIEEFLTSHIQRVHVENILRQQECDSNVAAVQNGIDGDSDYINPDPEEEVPVDFN